MPSLTRQDYSAWVATATATLNAVYPVSTVDGTASTNDLVYLYVHAKPETTTITPSGSWTHVATVTGGSGSAGVDTGATKTAVYKRTVPGGGITPSGAITPVALTGQSVAMAAMVAYRPSGPATFVDQVVNASVASGTSLAATAGSSTTIVDGDWVDVLIGAASDAATAQTPSTVAASGATFGSVVANPGNTVTTSGDDMASFLGAVECTAGSASGTLSTTGTGTGTSTRQVVWHVVSVGGDSVATNAPADAATIGMAAQDATVQVTNPNAAAAVASVAVAANNAVVNYSSAPTIGSAAVGMSAQDATVAIKASAGTAEITFVNTNVVPLVPITCAWFETTVTVDQHFCTVDLDFHEGSITLDAHAGEVGVEAHYGEVVVCGRE